MKLYELFENKIFKRFCDYLFEWNTALDRSNIKVWYNIDTGDVIELDQFQHHTEALVDNPRKFGVSPTEVRKRALANKYNVYNKHVMNLAFEKDWLRVWYHKKELNIEAKTLLQVRMFLMDFLESEESGRVVKYIIEVDAISPQPIEIDSENIDTFVKTGKAPHF